VNFGGKSDCGTPFSTYVSNSVQMHAKMAELWPKMWFSIWQPPPSWILLDTSSDGRSCWGTLFGSKGAISGWIKFKMATGGHLGKLQTAISQRRVIRSTSCLVLGWGFRGRQIQRRHFWLDQIQGRYWKTSNGHISATYYPIHCMYVRRSYFAVGL